MARARRRARRRRRWCWRRPTEGRSGAASSIAAGRCRRSRRGACAGSCSVPCARRLRRCHGVRALGRCWRRRSPCSAPRRGGASSSAAAFRSRSPCRARRARCRPGLWLLPLASAGLRLSDGAPGATRRSFRLPRRARRARATACRSTAARPRSMPAAASAPPSLELRREYPEARPGRHRVELAAPHRLCMALPLCARPSRRHLGAPTGRRSHWSICSSDPRAWPVPPPRPQRELRTGAWLASLEFEIATLVPQHSARRRRRRRSGSIARRFAARRREPLTRGRTLSRQPPFVGALAGILLACRLAALEAALLAGAAWSSSTASSSCRMVVVLSLMVCSSLIGERYTTHDARTTRRAA